MTRVVTSTIHFVLLAGLLAGSMNLRGAEPSPFRALPDDLVLGQTSVQAFAQDRDGFLWFGTQAGVEKFDGYRFESFRSDPDDPATLSNRFVTQLLVAENGHVWAGTRGGMSRIDPDSGRVTRIGLRLADGDVVWPHINYGGLVEDVDGDIFAADGTIVMHWSPGSDAAVPVEVEGPVQPRGRNALVLDRVGRLWLAATNGLWRYAREAGSFRPVLDSNRTGINPRLAEDMIAVGPGNGVTYVNANGVFIVDPEAPDPIRRLRPSEHGFPNDRVDAVAVDSGDGFWLRLEDQIVRIPAGRPQEWRRFEQPAFFGPSTNSKLSRLQLVETPDGSTWLAGRFGLVRYDPSSDRMTSFRHDPNDPRSLPQTLGEIGYRIFLDDFGVMWVGANLGGLARLPPQSDRFTHVQDEMPSLIGRNVVRAIAEQGAERHAGATELVWAANQNAGVSIWRRNAERDYEIMHHYPPSFEDKPSVGVVRAIALRPGTGSAWLGGSHALGRIETPGAPIELFGLDPELPGSIPGLRTLHFLDSEKLLAGGSGRVWLIDVSDVGRPTVLRRFDTPPGFQAFDLLGLDGGLVLVAGMGGLIELDPESGEIRVHYPAGRAEETPRNDVFHLARDDQGRIWAGTRGAGLLRIDLESAGGPKFRFYGMADGLPDDTIYAVLPDATGSLWLSSNRGVIRYDPDSGRVRQYTPADGLQAWEFNNTVAHVGASGRFYFGGINGWNVFRPGNVRDLLRPPRVHLQAVTVNEQPISLTGDNPGLDVSHDENRIVIDYVGLQFTDPDRIDYAVRMRGLDEQWIEVGNSRRARYASLAPGRYTFEVKAANLDGIWSSPRQLVQFSVARPPWSTPLAWLLYLALFFVLALAVLGYQKRKRRQLQQLVDRRTLQLQQQKELVDRQAGELEQALEARTLLFANVSHEFRTPLTLIRASIEKLEQAPDPEAAALGRKYVDRLLRMVEQLLDLSRLRLARPADSDSPWRLDSVVSQTVEAFRSGVEPERIHIESRVNGAWLTRCPQNLVEKILLNLISNAVKFTPPDGRIKVSLQPAAENAVICVEDTGPGISESDQAMIFKRFYRARAADDNHVSGAGIGLALVAEAARACGGSVDVTSKPGHGTCFWVSLPARRPAPGEIVRPARVDLDRQRLDLAALQPGWDSPEVPEPTAGAVATREGRGTILVVEDNADLRTYLAEALAPEWRVEQAVDGIRGLAAAREISPDVIVTDLMMPNVDGFQMLARLRENIETSHIPVLFLTARQDKATRIKAFSLSADAFLSKPFELKELKARLKQMMAQRERVRAHLMAQIGQPLEPDLEAGVRASGSEDPSPDLTPRDQRLLERLAEWLEANSGNSDVEIHAMAEAVHLTPRTLQRKLKSLTGRTPAAYLREYRLARARQLLLSSDDNVTDIAHACGFSSSQYFSRTFRDEHGAPPEKWRQNRSAAGA